MMSVTRSDCYTSYGAGEERNWGGTGVANGG